jgi:CRISPR-associated endoribonuclease Cas6
MINSARLPDLYACVLRLDALTNTRLERTQGHRAHGLFLELLRQVDPELATALHAPAPTKPFTVAPLQGSMQRLRSGSGYTLRIALLRSDLFPAFARSFLQPGAPEIRLGDAGFAVREVLVTPGAHPWTSLATWDELRDQAAAAGELTVHFVTPTAFTSGVDAAGHKRIELFPQPAAVFGSLLRRWNDLAPTPIDPELLGRVEIAPSSYVLRTEMLRFAKSPQLGFTGFCRYTLRGDDADLRWINALADAAFFLGVGYKTTQGMGLVRVTRGERPDDR